DPVQLPVPGSRRPAGVGGGVRRVAGAPAGSEWLAARRGRRRAVAHGGQLDEAERAARRRRGDRVAVLRGEGGAFRLARRGRVQRSPGGRKRDSAPARGPAERALVLGPYRE